MHCSPDGGMDDNNKGELTNMKTRKKENSERKLRIMSMIAQMDLTVHRLDSALI